MLSCFINIILTNALMCFDSTLMPALNGLYLLMRQSDNYKNQTWIGPRSKFGSDPIGALKDTAHRVQC